ncbi:MAG: alpha/beta fold hydrolase [Roseivirga sp.]
MKKALINVASTVFPDLMVKMAYNYLTNPQIKKLRERELAVLNGADKAKIEFKGFQIQTYCWQGGDKPLLLIHGWEGQAGNFSSLIAPLQKAGFTIYAFDGPSHGFSSKGPTSLFEFTELVGVLIEKYKPVSLISHSFGGVATTYALYSNPELSVESYVLLTTPDKFSERIQAVVDQVGVTEKVRDRLTDRLEKETPMPVHALNVSSFVKSVNVERALIIHDKNDRIIPIDQSRNVQKNWPCCQLLEVEGTGHFKVLTDNKVIKSLLDFLN